MTTLASLHSAIGRLNQFFGGASETEAIQEAWEGIAQLKSDLGQLTNALSATNTDTNLGAEVNRLVRELAHDIEDSAEGLVFRHEESACKSKSKSRSRWSNLWCFNPSYEKSFVEDVGVLSSRARALLTRIDSRSSSRKRDKHMNLSLSTSAAHHIHVDEPILIGIQQGYIEKLTEALLGGGSALRETAIYGMAGIGKTTLARWVCDSTPVREHFECIVWSNLTRDHKPLDIVRSLIINLCPDARSQPWRPRNCC